MANFYFSTKPCKRGHLSKRYVSTKKCVECYQTVYRERSNLRARKLYQQEKEKYDNGSKRWQQRNPLRMYFIGLRRSAKLRGIPFDLVFEDLPPIPKICPVLGIPIALGRSTGKIGNESSLVSIDRINNDKGYTKDNVVVVSRRANVLKSNATIAELEKLVNFYKALVD